MRKTLSKPETHIVMRVDREAGVIDLRVFAANLRLQKTTIVGTATLRTEDLREVVSLLTQELQFEDLLAAKAGNSLTPASRICHRDERRSGLRRPVLL
jgi:hypothetical protein